MGGDEQITVETLRWHKDLKDARVGPWLDMAMASSFFTKISEWVEEKAID